ncbi:MAG TPA: Sua5/YciO/YrdC/YwlC family protein [Candidatus Thalassarchaeaceae archaeon]|nr:Sua5/YciO/YrdC/YwlC family protein [Candidatus Thalassarchaeaceae archaeon]
MAGDEMLSDAIVERAISGFPVIYPTSNLPALGCVPTTDALDLLYKLKQRKAEMKVSLAVSDLEQAAEIVEVNQNVVRLLSDFPTGSLTLVLPALKQMDERVGGGKIAIRVIDTPITQLLLKRVRVRWRRMAGRCVD